MIYLDNAATSFPKPAEGLQRGLEEYLQKGFSPGRGGYDAVVEAEERVTGIRRRLCRFFGADETYHCCFTYNATEALNLLIQGLIRPGLPRGQFPVGAQRRPEAAAPPATGRT